MKFDWYKLDPVETPQGQCEGMQCVARNDTRILYATLSVLNALQFGTSVILTIDEVVSPERSVTLVHDHVYEKLTTKGALLKWKVIAEKKLRKK